MGLGEKKKLFEGVGWGSSLVPDVENDGFLEIVLQGKDAGNSYLSLVVFQASGGGKVPIGGVTWSFNVQKDFISIASCVIPIPEGKPISIEAWGQRNDSQIKFEIYWTPTMWLK